MKASSLLDMKLDEKINEDLFEKKNNEIAKNITTLKSQKEKLEKVNLEKIQAIQEKMVELSGSLYTSYKSMDTLGKSHLLKSVMVELSISTKKELTVEDNKLFKLIKSLENLHGGPTGARTRDLRIKSPALYQLSYRSMR